MSQKSLARESLANLLLLIFEERKVGKINRSAESLSIVSTDLDGFSLVNHGWFTSFPSAKFSCYTVIHKNVRGSSINYKGIGDAEKGTKVGIGFVGAALSLLLIQELLINLQDPAGSVECTWGRHCFFACSVFLNESYWYQPVWLTWHHQSWSCVLKGSKSNFISLSVFVRATLNNVVRGLSLGRIKSVLMWHPC